MMSSNVKSLLGLITLAAALLVFAQKVQCAFKLRIFDPMLE